MTVFETVSTGIKKIMSKIHSIIHVEKNMNAFQKAFDVTHLTEYATAASLYLRTDNGIFDHTQILTRTQHEKERPQVPLTIHYYIHA